MRSLRLAIACMHCVEADEMYQEAALLARENGGLASETQVRRCTDPLPRACFTVAHEPFQMGSTVCPILLLQWCCSYFSSLRRRRRCQQRSVHTSSQSFIRTRSRCSTSHCHKRVRAFNVRAIHSITFRCLSAMGWGVGGLRIAFTGCHVDDVSWWRHAVAMFTTTACIACLPTLTAVSALSADRSRRQRRRRPLARTQSFDERRFTVTVTALP